MEHVLGDALEAAAERALVLKTGARGLRTIIDDYSRKDRTRFWLNSLLLLSMGFTLVLGTYVIVTFNPNIGG